MDCAGTIVPRGISARRRSAGPAEPELSDPRVSASAGSVALSRRTTHRHARQGLKRRGPDTPRKIWRGTRKHPSAGDYRSRLRHRSTGTERSRTSRVPRESSARSGEFAKWICGGGKLAGRHCPSCACGLKQSIRKTTNGTLLAVVPPISFWLLIYSVSRLRG